MKRSVDFGIGITLFLSGMAVFYWVRSFDPKEYTLSAILIGAVFSCPGSILIGRAIWPPDKK